MVKIARKNYFTAGFILTHKNHFLMVLEAKKNKWSFPKGRKDDKDDDSLITACRELNEETNIVIQKDNKNIINSVMYKKCIFYIYEFIETPKDICFASNVEIKDIKWIHRSKIKEHKLNYITELYFKFYDKIL